MYSLLAIPVNTKFNAKSIRIENSEVISLEGNAKLIDKDQWKNKLYKEVSKQNAPSVPVKLIPYYAWGNRGHTGDDGMVTGEQVNISFNFFIKWKELLQNILLKLLMILRRQRNVLAGEQSSGTFVAVPGETEELKQRFAARVEKIEALETVDSPAIPGATSATGKYNRANVEVSWSIENFGYNLPVMVSTLQGNLMR